MVVGFLAEIENIQYRAFICRFNGANLYCWWWLQDGGGHVTHFDLVRRERCTFPGLADAIKDYHSSYHASGQRQDSLLSNAGQKAKLSCRVERPLRDRDDWRVAFTIPLDDHYSRQCISGPWNELKSPVVLRASDFDGAAGVNLVLSVRRSEISRNVAEAHPKGPWIFRVRDRWLVMLAEPIR